MCRACDKRFGREFVRGEDHRRDQFEGADYRLHVFCSVQIDRVARRRRVRRFWDRRGALVQGMDLRLRARVGEPSNDAARPMRNESEVALCVFSSGRPATGLCRRPFAGLLHFDAGP